MKWYLGSYCNYQQDDWFQWLFMIEFVFNVATSALTELFAFMTNYEFESRMSFDSSIEDDQELVRKRIQDKKAFDIIDKMKSIWEFIKKKLINAQKSQKRYADQKRVISLDYVIENIVWLFIKNIKTKRSFRKLNHKWIESYKIKKILKEAC